MPPILTFSFKYARILLFSIMLVPVFTSCTEDPRFAVRTELQPSILAASYYDYLVTGNDGIRLLESAPVNTDIEMTVVTTLGGCSKYGDYVLEVSDSLVTYSPRDYFVVEMGPNVGCKLDLGFVHRKIILNFDQPGMKTITINGRTKNMEPLILTRVITIY